MSIILKLYPEDIVRKVYLMGVIAEFGWPVVMCYQANGYSTDPIKMKSNQMYLTL